MEDHMKRLLSSVNKDSYSFSKGFVGYCYTDKCDNKLSYVNIMIELIEFLAPSARMASSLNLNYSLEEHKDGYCTTTSEDKLVESLIQSKVMSFCDPNADENFFKDFEMLNREQVSNSIYFMIFLGGASGHLFFVDVKESIVIYPHDDGGLGFIFNGGEEQRQNQLELLSTFHKRYKEAFQLVLKTQNRGKIRY